ncbi:MAG: winged helix-turn-helix domain-containing protein [Solirubrobacterales bacterium]|nr:winged helix-turn-helix domain-containing protein [Solirubrobacterales bacterium]
MCPSIDADDEVFDVIKKHAEPFVDTPNTVLRRLLGLDQPQSRSTATAEAGEPTRRAAPGSLLPESEYEIPILRFLAERGGRAPSREAVDAVGAALDSKLTELDKQALKSGDIRWENRAAFVRLRLVERGELMRGSPRGTWEISDRGRERLRSAT